MSLLAPEITMKLAAVHSLGDAIEWRSDRLDEPCPDCTTGQKCTDHAWDVRLLEFYQDLFMTAFDDAVSGLDTSDIARVLQPGDDLPPPSRVLVQAITGHLSRLSLGDPVVITTLDGHPVAIDLDVHNATVRPLSPAPGSQTGA